MASTSRPSRAIASSIGRRTTIRPGKATPGSSSPGSRTASTRNAAGTTSSPASSPRKARRRRTPQTTFILANRMNNFPRPADLASTTGRLFMGIQLRCAECHDHPYVDGMEAGRFLGRRRLLRPVRATTTSSPTDNAQPGLLRQADRGCQEGNAVRQSAEACRFSGAGRRGQHRHSEEQRSDEDRAHRASEVLPRRQTRVEGR